MNTQMAGMTGGAVGAAPTGSPGMGNALSASAPEQLNTYIYDHLCSLKHYDLARQFANTLPILKTTKTKKEMNGDDMDMDSKDDKRPDDLPTPNIALHFSENSFLLDWWCQFWDIYSSARARGGNSMSGQFLGHHMSQVKMRQMQQQNMMGGAGNMMGRPQQFAGLQPNGINNMQKQAIANRGGMPGMMPNKMQQNMQDGERPQSPGSMGNAPSPSKRPRIDDGNFNGGPPAQAGRGQPMPNNQMGNMPGQPNGGMMMQNGMNASEMGQMNFAQNGNGDQKFQLAGAGAQGMEPNMEMMGGQRPMANGANQSGGNHALQDYQMQLMLLEQQNKKRLLMARQEQDNINHVPTSGPGGPGQMQFAGQAAMSPSNGGRPGPSPNPEQMKQRMQTPKMGPNNVPGSPAIPGDMNRGSPVPGFDQNGMPPNMRQQMFAAQQQGMMAQGQPPSSHPNFNGMNMPNMNAQNMEQMRMQAQRGQMPNGQWTQGGQPMMQTPSQQGQMGTPQQRNATMPPPPAPNNGEQQRTQPSSPAQTAGGPPTPSQAPKSAPKGKKEAAKKNTPQKGAAAKKDAAATPAASEAPAATPTPSTPITPMHPSTFSNKPGANATAGPPPQQPPQGAPVPAMDPSAPFDLGGSGGEFNLDFTADGPDVLENFDFDSFLHNTDDTNNFGNFDFMNLGEA